MSHGLSQSSIRWKLFIMMVLEIAIWGAWQPKIFAYMGLLGYETWQQFLVGAVFGIASIVGIFFSNQFADRNFSAERFLAVSHIIGGLALVGAAFVTSFWPFFALFLLYGMLYVPTISVTNSLAFANLENPAKDFGFVRMGGTIGWIVVSWPFIFLIGATATVEDYRWIFLVGAVISFGLAGYSMTLPHTPPRKDAEGLDKLAWIKAGKLLTNPYVLVLFIVTLIDSVIHNGYFVVSDIFLTQRVGISANLSMVVMSIGQVAEIITMLILGFVLVKAGWKVTMIVGILGHALRFATFAFVPDVPALIIAVQVLHGICYAFFFATVYIFVDAVFPKDVRSSAQGLFNLLILGVGMVVASWIFPQMMAKIRMDEPKERTITVSDASVKTPDGAKDETKSLYDRNLVLKAIPDFEFAVTFELKDDKPIDIAFRVTQEKKTKKYIGPKIRLANNDECGSLVGIAKASGAKLNADGKNTALIVVRGRDVSVDINDKNVLTFKYPEKPEKPELKSMAGLIVLPKSGIAESSKLRALNVIDWQMLFLVPTALALAAIVLMALFFRPPTRGPEESETGGDDESVAAAPH